ncbi:regulatory protein RecX [Altererythrobacter aquiaggeris]|uniref:regulatory protein RecX n=1 Tax=Aestuarierythrobacter aquiaggeris TaxID=1898396 RepID=UPI0030187A9E
MRHEQGQKGRDHRQKRRPPKPLTRQRFDEMSLAYVARFATSAHKLKDYLRRKLRERGWDESEGELPDLDAMVARYVELGYVDDEGYARMKSGGLLRRGYGPGRVRQALSAAGIDEATREAVSSPAQVSRQAALTMARKRRFGPFGTDGLDRAKRDKQISAMLRAGHSFDSAKAMIDAETMAAAEEWAGLAEDY